MCLLVKVVVVVHERGGGGIVNGMEICVFR